MINEQPIVNNEQPQNDGEEKKKKIKTNKKIVLSEEPVVFNIPVVEENPGASVVMNQEPAETQEVTTSSVPTEQSGNITF